MNPEAKKYLKEILEKEPEALSQTEIEFLRARASYLKKSQLKEYKSVLEVKEEAVVAKPTLKELKEKAAQLGIEFKSNVTVDQLIVLIEEKQTPKE